MGLVVAVHGPQDVGAAQVGPVVIVVALAVQAAPAAVVVRVAAPAAVVVPVHSVVVVATAVAVVEATAASSASAPMANRCPARPARRVRPASSGSAPTASHCRPRRVWARTANRCRRAPAASVSRSVPMPRAWDPTEPRGTPHVGRNGWPSVRRRIER